MSLKFNIKPYFDDFTDATTVDGLSPKEKYNKILFRPSHAVQARELTQIQSILQNQVTSMGNHLFKEGAMIIPGHVSASTKVDYIKLQSFSGADLKDLIGKTIEASNSAAGTTTGLKAIVVAVYDADGTDPDTIYVQYQNSGVGDEKLIVADEYMKTSAIAGGFVLQAAVSSTTPIGFGSVAFLESGIYYIKGHFVVVQKGQLVLEKYGQTPTYDVGLKITESIVTSAEDDTLNDNANGTLNYAAPGAHRHQIKTELITQAIGVDTVGTDDDFLRLIQIDNGIIIKEVRATEYSIVEETLARRTFDESGNYTVRPFDVDIKNHASNATKLTAGLDPSKAYVQGYEIETLSTINVELDKARDAGLFESAALPIQIGNYIDVDTLEGLPDITTFGQMNLYESRHTAGTFASAITGWARCRSIEKVIGTSGTTAAIYRLYLFDITMNTGSYFRKVRGFKQAGTPEFVANLWDTTGNIANDTDAILQQPNRNLMVYKLPFNRVKTCDSQPDGVTADFNYLYDTVKIIGTGTVAGNDTQFTTVGPTETFNVFDDNWILTIASGANSGDIINISSSNVAYAAGLQTVTITTAGLADGTPLTLCASTKRSIQHKTKSLTTGGIDNEELMAFSAPTSSMQLGKADGYKLLNVYMSNDFTTPASALDNDVSEYYELDNGQRDNYYDISRVKLRPGSAFVPSGRLLIKYNYFTHGGGDFFSVDSYDGVIPYEEIPEYISANTGEAIELRSAIDFRPRMDNSGGNFSGTGSVTSVCPDPSSTFSTDVQYYLSRLDKIVLDAKGEFSVIKGVSSLDPELPDSPKEAMALYNVLVPAYTLTPDEVEATLVDNKRYTMRDIGKLEKRIDNIEYYTSLSLLESEATNRDIIDSAGLARPKAGFVVDSFNTHTVGNVYSPDYRIGIDRQNHRLRPLFSEKNVRLKYNATESAYVTKTGDVVTLPFTEEALFNQNKASATINVNPYQVFEWTGSVELSPSQDEWKDIVTRPKVTVNQDGVYDAMMSIVNATDAMGTTWNSWQTNWTGVQSSSWESGRGGNWATTTTRTITTQQQARTGIETINTPSTLKTNLGDRVVEINFVPFVRARYVSFKANSLKPNTTVYAFFDGINISEWAREDSVFVDFTGTDTEIAAQMTTNYGTSVAGNGDIIHPQGKTALVTNDAGEVNGSFWIPNTEATRFKTGTRVFKLTDSVTNDTSFESTTASTQYIAKGLIETKENVTISTRVPMLNQRQVFGNRTVVNTTESASTRWWDPLAQSFLLDTLKQPYGAYITSIDLYFHTKSSTLPVTLQIREMNQGMPTPTIVPFSNVTLNPSAVSVVDLTITNPSPNETTTFTFKSPVYLQSGKEYCFVVMSNSTDYECWYAGIGENDYVSGKRISKQPYAGVLFTSQNASTWSADQNKDLKFKINRAKFDYSNTSNVVLENENIPAIRLIKNALRTTSGSKVVRVFQKNHGFIEEGMSSIKSYVTLSGISGTVNGIPAVELNVKHLVFNVEQDSYEITVATTPATGTGIDGGTDIYATENMMYNTFYTSIQSMNFPVTNYTWGVKMATGVSLGNSILQPYMPDTFYDPIIINRNFHVDRPKAIASVDNSSSKTFKLKGTLTSTSDYVSPIIDLERCSVIGVQNRIDNVTGQRDIFTGDGTTTVYTLSTDPYTAAAVNIYVDGIIETGYVLSPLDPTKPTEDPLRKLTFTSAPAADKKIDIRYQTGQLSGYNIVEDYVPETVNVGASGLARYLTKNISLKDVSDEIKVFLDVNRPSGTFVDVYYKTHDDDEVIDSLDWIIATSSESIPYSDNTEEFREVEYTISPGDFSVFALKIVFRSINSSRVPQCKDLRAIAVKK
jgi:hypothetical protein